MSTTSDAISLADYLTLPGNEKPWLIDALLPIGGIACIHGQAKAKKSFLALQLARDIANGDPFLGFKTAPGRILFIQLDTPRSIWQRRIAELMANNFGLSPEGQSKFFLADTLHAPYPFHILKEPAQAWLKRQIELYKPDLIFFDVLRKLYRGNENDSDLMDEVVEAIKHHCQPAAACVIAHSKKANAEFDSGTLGEMRGSGAQAASYDAIMRLQKGAKGKPSSLSIEGRATGEYDISLVNNPDNLLFQLNQDGLFDLALKDALTREFSSERKRAEHLSAITGAEFDKCMSAIRRRREKK